MIPHFPNKNNPHRYLQESPRKINPYLKMESPAPVVERPESSKDAQSCEGMILRPKHKSPEQPPEKLEDRIISPAEKKRPLPSALIEALKSEVPGKLSADGTIPPKYTGDDPEEAKQNAEARQEWREARMFQYVGYIKHRLVSSRGFTSIELDICRPFMMKHDFELEDGPIPKDKKRFKEFLDQVRATKGYGVTIRWHGGVDGTGFVPLKDDLEKKDPETMEFVEEMTNLLLREMKRKRKQTYTAAGVKNLVRTSLFYFLTIGVEHTGPAAPPQVVEALFIRPAGARAVRKFQLLEWKIKEGSTVVFCTADLEE